MLSYVYARLVLVFAFWVTIQQIWHASYLIEQPLVFFLCIVSYRGLVRPEESETRHLLSFTALLVFQQFARLIQQTFFVHPALALLPILLTLGFLKFSQQSPWTLAWITLFVILPPDLGYTLVFIIPVCAKLPWHIYPIELVKVGICLGGFVWSLMH